MAVKISTDPKVYSLTSPPKQPVPYPHSELIAEEMVYGDRKILVTVPFPDTLELTANLLNEHMANPDTTGDSANKIAKALDQELLEWLANLKKEKPLVQPKWVTEGKRAEFALAYDPAQPLNKAKLFVVRKPGADFGSWSIKLEFSVSKAGPAGLVKLTSLMGDALPLNVAALLPDFRVSRVDVAIDLIGANPLDLIAHIQKPGKRQVFIGASGHPESIYLYETKKPLKAPPSSLSYNTKGPMRMKMYERRDYHRQLKLDPPYGDCPVTRIEFECRWRKGRPLIGGLAGIKNPIAGRRVAYAAKLAKTSSSAKDWVAFCLAAFGGGVGTALQKWKPSVGIAHYQRYLHCEGDLVNADNWAEWHKGISFTGLDAWTNQT